MDIYLKLIDAIQYLVLHFIPEIFKLFEQIALIPLLGDLITMVVDYIQDKMYGVILDHREEYIMGMIGWIDVVFDFFEPG